MREKTVGNIELISNEEEKLVCLFHRRDKTGFIDKIAVVFADIHKVHHAIGYTFTIVAHGFSLFSNMICKLTFFLRYKQKTEMERLFCFF